MTAAVSSRYEFDYDGEFLGQLYHIKSAKYLAVDTETTGLRVKDGIHKCIGISVSGRSNGVPFSYYFPVAHTHNNLSPENQKILFAELQRRDRSCPIILHNAKFDLESLESAGCVLTGFFYDTLLMMKLLNENLFSYKLDDLAKRILKNNGKNKPPEWVAFFKLYGWAKSDHFPPWVMGLYATGDTDLTRELFEWIWPRFKKEGFDG